MNIKMLDTNGVTLKTEGKYCKENIAVTINIARYAGEFEDVVAYIEEETELGKSLTVNSYTETNNDYGTTVVLAQR